MSAALVLRCVGLCAVLCVLLLFFFPLLQGPFQATHGPTTDFRATQASASLFLMIVLASNVWWKGLALRQSPRLHTPLLKSAEHSLSVLTNFSILRC